MKYRKGNILYSPTTGVHVKITKVSRSDKRLKGLVRGGARGRWGAETEFRFADLRSFKVKDTP